MKGSFDPRNAGKWPAIYNRCHYLPTCINFKWRSAKMCSECWAVVRRRRDGAKQRERK
jgi:hypothetical protein